MQVFREVVGEICRGLAIGQTFVRQDDPHNLRWTWRNTASQKLLVIRLVELKRAGEELNCDFGKQLLLDFVQGKISAIQTKHSLERLERLSAFI
jgi:hypothetical protein